MGIGLHEGSFGFIQDLHFSFFHAQNGSNSRFFPHAAAQQTAA
jgi:hypothetical protein